MFQNSPLPLPCKHKIKTYCRNLSQLKKIQLLYEVTINTRTVKCFVVDQKIRSRKSLNFSDFYRLLIFLIIDQEQSTSFFESLLLKKACFLMRDRSKW